MTNPRDRLTDVETRFATRVVGQKALLQRLLIGLLTEGHLLLEGMPGLAKTLAVKTLADLLQLKFQRVQFTPDLLPADVVGTQIYQPATADFRVRQGPIFANLLLADEINRAPAKVQSALLEAMQERQVTIGEQSLALPTPFLVLATENPIDQEGTYPLPEASLDRFLMKIVVGYPSREEERAVLEMNEKLAGAAVLEPLLGPSELLELRSAVDAIYLDAKLKEYIVDFVRATRSAKEFNLGFGTWVRFGASPRATIALTRVAKASAFLAKRDFVLPDDIRGYAKDVLRHRIILSYEGEAEEKTTDDIVQAILDGLPLP